LREQAVQLRSKQGTSSNAKRKKRVSDYKSSADEGTGDSGSDFMDVDEDKEVKKKATAKAKRSTNAAPTGKRRVDPLKVEHDDKDSGGPKPKFKYETFPFLFPKSLPFLRRKPLISAGQRRRLQE
jgi:hypothetical protein